MKRSFAKDAREGASAKEAGTNFHIGTVRGKQLHLKESEDVENSLNFLECVDLAFTVTGVR